MVECERWCLLPQPLRGTEPQSVWAFDSRPPLGSRRPPAFSPASGRSRPYPECQRLEHRGRTWRPQGARSLLLHPCLGLKASTCHQAYYTDKSIKRRCGHWFISLHLLTSILEMYIYICLPFHHAWSLIIH